MAPTGFGKTILGGAIVEGALRKGRTVTFVVPAIDLIGQTVDALEREGINRIGVVQGDHPRTDPTAFVQVASVQTLARRKPAPADVVVLDECHIRFASLSKWMHDPAWAKVPFIGLSATPWSRGLGQDFDDLLIAATTRDLIRDGYLSPFRVYSPSAPDLSRVRTVAGDYRGGDLSNAMSASGLVGDVVSEWCKRAADLPTLVFAVDRAHARRLAEEFAAADVAVAYLDGETPREERERTKAAFQSGAVRVIVSVSTLATGVDLDVRCIVLARPTQSEILHTQIVGRGLRTAPGKERCLILDHAGNHARLGFVTDVHHDHLDDGRERPKARTASTPRPVACPACTALRPPSRTACPACGDAPAPAARPVVNVAGTLKEVRKVPVPPSRQERQRWYSELLWIARHRNYKSAWVGYQFKARFGAWPRGLSDRIARPGPDVLAHVQASHDAYRPPRYEDFHPGPT
jgi:superfamily II DNA or RNA helicase